MRHLYTIVFTLSSIIALSGCGSIDVQGGAATNCQPGCISGTPKACVDGKEELLPPCQEGFECAPETGQCIPEQEETRDTPDIDSDGVLNADDCAPEDPAYHTRTCAEDAECGDDGCGGVCGTCEEGATCTDARCVASCTPECTAKQCGDDGCGGSCGSCEAEFPNCNDEGQCEAEPCTCGDKVCGDDGCGGSCGECAEGESCSESGMCEPTCDAECGEKVCGDDGCGGSCGECAEGESCNESGACEATCQPECEGKTCGDDGCGGTCGSCDGDLTCSDAGTCVADATLAPNGCPTECQGCFDGTICTPTSEWWTCTGENTTVCGWAHVEIHVDMNAYDASLAPYYQGEFNDWCGDCFNAGADPDGDGIYTFTQYLSTKLWQWKPSLVNWTSPSSAPAACWYDDENYNYYFEVLASDINSGEVVTVGPVCFGDGAGTCDACDAVCEPSCADTNACGDDGCGGSCGSCDASAQCSDGVCVCVPQCEGAVCGDDGCGGVCGECAPDSSCVGINCVPNCTPAESCDGITCGVIEDGCGGYLDCGECADNEACTGDGQCVCIPDCEGKVCGGDGCGASCGTCPNDGICDQDGQCACTPDCSGSVDLSELELSSGSDIGDESFSCLDDSAVVVVESNMGTPFVLGRLQGTPQGESGCNVSIAYRNLTSGESNHLTGISASMTNLTFGLNAYLDLDSGSISSSSEQGSDLLITCCSGGFIGGASVNLIFNLPPVFNSGASAAAVSGTPFEGVGLSAECGDDGCGGSCGTCSTSASCNSYQVCECTQTEDMICIDNDSWSVDSCGNPYALIASCGFGCDAGVCNNCTPDCTGKTCGNDGCGGSCGTCSGGEVCSSAGQCECVPTNDLVCGPGAFNMGFALYPADSCGNANGDPVNSCLYGCSNGACTSCVPSCDSDTDAPYCGGDGCGGQCSCEGGQYCGPNNTCGTCWVDEHCPSGDVCVTSQVQNFCAECAVDSDCKGANQACLGNLCTSLLPPTLIINEIDYDNVDFDGQEYIELYNNGTASIAPAQLANVYLYIIDKEALIYTVTQTIALSDLLSGNMAAGSYALLGTSSLLNSLDVSPPSLTISPNTLPNGVVGASAVALVIGDLESESQVILDSVQYEGTIQSVFGLANWSAEGSGTAADTGTKSLSRCPNGSDSNNNNADFDLTTTKTPGEANYCSTLPPVDGGKD